MQILTALGMKNLYEKIKNIKELNLYKNDVQYKEGILEVLKNNNQINLIIIYEKLEGEISIEKLIKEIKIINNEIKIIFLLENKNENLEKILFNENINNIFYNNEINFEEFILKIKNINYSEEEVLKKEIKKLNKIINQKNEEINKFKNINKEENFFNSNKKENKINKIDNVLENINTELLYNKKIVNKKNLLNSRKVENNRLLIITDFYYYNLIQEKNKLIKNINKKIKIDLLNLNKLNKKIKNYNNLIFLINSNFNEINKLNKIINFINKKYLIKKNKINIIFIFNKKQKNLKNKLISINILKLIFKNCNVIKKINIYKEKNLVNIKLINIINSVISIK